MLEICSLLLSVVILPLVTPCPPREQLYPCVCESTGYQAQITCSHVDDVLVLLDAVHSLNSMKKFYSFTIKDGIFRYIPHDIFRNIRFQEFQIISSSFMALTDTDTAFEGLEEDLVSLVITDSSLLSPWNWSALRKLQKLVKFHIEVGLTLISKDIHKISCLNVRDLSFARNRITYIDDTAFSAFKEVLSIRLNRNLITELKRSMFPNPAALLVKLDLGHNEIEELPSDMFENMPSLEILNLESNKLLTLEEKTLRPVWGQLRHFDAMDNHLRCDCRLIWITESKFPKHMTAVCDKPKILTWKHLKDLSVKDLWCAKGVDGMQGEEVMSRKSTLKIF